MKLKYDFSGYATRNDLTCGDGRVIKKDAFKHHDGQVVPLVWQHLHDEPANILGHALLENRPDGVYCYGKFNDTESGKNAKALVKHGDITALSIYANKLKQAGSSVLHGMIGEVSLVIKGANPGAVIENLSFQHGDGSYATLDDEAIIYTGLNFSNQEIAHGEEDTPASVFTTQINQSTLSQDQFASMMNTYLAHQANAENRTVQDVFDSMTEEQKTVVYAMVGAALSGDDEMEQSYYDEGEENMKRNIFDRTKQTDSDELMHIDTDAIFADLKSKKYGGSLKETILAHGIEDIEYLFPDARNATNTPILIQRDMGWVPKVMQAVHNTPFSRVKSIFADLTEDDARARGYITGNRKTEEVFSLLKRTTSPQTVYKKQKLDRDDVIDITDFDVVSWIKSEMRTMLDEEIARAILVGDGRLTSSDDKIKEDNIRPIWKDHDLFTIKAPVVVAASASESEKARKFIQAAIRARKKYKGSGSPVLYASEDIITECLLIEDLNQRIVYDTIEKLATVLRVKEIVTVPIMEGLSRNVDGKDLPLMGIIVNLTDYNVGADKGGSINMFDDFDIDYNAYKYLIETRCSGALIKPFSAIVLELATSVG